MSIELKTCTNCHKKAPLASFYESENDFMGQTCHLCKTIPLPQSVSGIHFGVNVDNDTPEYYKEKQGDVYDIFIRLYGFDKWLTHVCMESLQYLIRAERKGDFKGDIQKVITILKRILQENNKQEEIK